MRLLIIIIFHFVIYAGGRAQETVDSTIKIADPEEFYIQMHLHNYHLLIDVRTRIEFRIARIPGAILAEKSNILYSLTDTLDRDIPLFLYCAINTRSLAAAKMLAKKGFNTIFVLEPGFIGWKSAGKEIDKKRVRQNK